ncbi:MAG: cobalamin-binding protein [Pseudomonadota bacterium]
MSAIDFEGREIRLAEPARRIVALAPHIAENVFSAGAGDRLVGAVSYSDYPEQAKSIPRVGGYKTWDLETIAVLEPDLIIVWSSGSDLERLEPLRSMRVPVFVSEPRQLEDIPRAIRAYGVLAGTQAISEPTAARISEELRSLREQFATERRSSVFYQVWNDPLQTLSGRHLISTVIELCGGRNIFADLPILAPKISVEAVLAANPEVIVASGMGESKPEWLDDWRRFAELSAVQNDALLFVDPDLLQRPTARILLGARSMCEQMAALR